MVDETIAPKCCSGRRFWKKADHPWTDSFFSSLAEVMLTTGRENFSPLQVIWMQNYSSPRPMNPRNTLKSTLTLKPLPVKSSPEVLASYTVVDMSWRAAMIHIISNSRASSSRRTLVTVCTTKMAPTVPYQGFTTKMAPAVSYQGFTNKMTPTVPYQGL